MRRNIIPYNPRLKELARQLRNNSTQSEIKLWLQLKGKQMRGYDFHRQKPLLNFIADFFCHELKLVIELDGFTHQFEEVVIRDAEKTRSLEKIGLTVMRFEDQEVHHDMMNVLRTIEIYIEEFEEQHTLAPLKRGT